jgi:hypothetical protein
MITQRQFFTLKRSIFVNLSETKHTRFSCKKDCSQNQIKAHVFYSCAYIHYLCGVRELSNSLKSKYIFGQGISKKNISDIKLSLPEQLLIDVPGRGLPQLGPRQLQHGDPEQNIFNPVHTIVGQLQHGDPEQNVFNPVSAIFAAQL